MNIREAYDDLREKTISSKVRVRVGNRVKFVKVERVVDSYYYSHNDKYHHVYYEGVIKTSKSHSYYSRQYIVELDNGKVEHIIRLQIVEKL